MFLPDHVDAKLVPYSNTLPISISHIAYASPTTQTITIPEQFSAPYAGGDNITISGINSYYNGNFEVVSSTTTTITYIASPGAAYPGGGTVAPRYSWNVNSNWASYYANFMRLYNTPNVGSILVAGNLTAQAYVTPGVPTTTTENFAVTVQWSQAFGLNQAPGSWAPTVTNIANQLEVPLRGPALDAFPSNGNFFLCSYWDTVVFSPLNYSTTSAPIIGVRLYNQGRGLLSSNCWANTDKLVYGVDARDVWVFDGQDFQGLGNQRVKNWFYDQLDPLYVDRVFMQINTQKNQVEIYYPTTEATEGVPNKMLSYRYDIDVWNAPRDVNSATFATESPVWTATPVIDWLNVAATTVTGTGTGARFNIIQEGSAYKSYASQGDIVAAGSGYVVNNQIKILGTLLGGATPANDAFITVLAVNGTGGITDFTIPTGIGNGVWDYNEGSRIVVYARGDEDKRIVMKDTGFYYVSDVNGETLPITSYFRRDNIKMLPDYSGKLLVHRILPEVINLNDADLPIDPAAEPTLVGSVDIKIEGANSVGQLPVSTTAITVDTDTDTPWAQINQNAHRVNSIEIGNSSQSNIWLCSATTWQFTQTEDDR
jgi:hypothetical protein